LKHVFCEQESDHLFVETNSQSSFVVATRASFYLRDYSIYEPGQQETYPADHGSEESGLIISAEYAEDTEREAIHWLTVQYECFTPNVEKTIGVRLQMIDFSETPRDVTFFWKKVCSEVESQQPKPASRQNSDWTFNMHQLNVAGGIFEQLENSPRRNISIDWSLIPAATLLLCGGVLLALFAVLVRAKLQSMRQAKEEEDLCADTCDTDTDTEDAVPRGHLELADPPMLATTPRYVQQKENTV